MSPEEIARAREIIAAAREYAETGEAPEDFIGETEFILQAITGWTLALDEIERMQGLETKFFLMHEAIKREVESLLQERDRLAAETNINSEICGLAKSEGLNLFNKNLELSAREKVLVEANNTYKTIIADLNFENGHLKGREKVLVEALSIAAAQLEGIVLALRDHGRNIDVTYLIQYYTSSAAKAREAALAGLKGEK